MSRPKGSKNKPKVADSDRPTLDDALKIPYERTTSDDPIEQMRIDLFETGRCISEVRPDGIRRIDPLGQETAVALYNAEHPEQKTTILNGPIFDTGKITKRLNELIDHEPLPFGQVPFPEDWDKLSKAEKLKFFTANRK